MAKTVEQILQEKLHEQMKFNTILMDEIQELRPKVRQATALLKQLRLITENHMKRIEVLEYNVRDCTNTSHHKDVI